MLNLAYLLCLTTEEYSVEPNATNMILIRTMSFYIKCRLVCICNVILYINASYQAIHYFFKSLFVIGI